MLGPLAPEKRKMDLAQMVLRLSAAGQLSFRDGEQGPSRSLSELTLDYHNQSVARMLMIQGRQTEKDFQL